MAMNSAAIALQLTTTRWISAYCEDSASSAATTGVAYFDTWQWFNLRDIVFLTSFSYVLLRLTKPNNLDRPAPRPNLSRGVHAGDHDERGEHADGDRSASSRYSWLVKPRLPPPCYRRSCRCREGTRLPACSV